MRLRHYSRWTEKAYVDWIRRYILFHQKKHPSTMGATEIVTFLSWLAVDKRVSASTQNQALSAVLFLYKQVLRLDIGPIEHVPRARMPDKLPVVLSREEIGQLMKHVEGTMWLIVALLYGTGVRLRGVSGAPRQGPRLRSAADRGPWQSRAPVRARSQVPGRADRMELAVRVSSITDLSRSEMGPTLSFSSARIRGPAFRHPSCSACWSHEARELSQHEARLQPATTTVPWASPC